MIFVGVLFHFISDDCTKHLCSKPRATANNKYQRKFAIYAPVTVLERVREGNERGAMLRGIFWPWLGMYKVGSE
jgi:hypothetical protein